jgi:hypothetical protein
MTLVRIVKSWSKPDLLRQTPGGAGVWGDVRFTLDPVNQCDYLVIINHLPEAITINVPLEHIWCFVQEPPIPPYRWIRKGFPYYQRVHTQDTQVGRANIVQTHGSLPWHLDRSYDQLTSLARPDKTRDLSWITSNMAYYEGHRRRLKFLARLQAANVPFDLFGRGFTPLQDKWDGIAPYRYTIAVENHSGPDYWTEKIADCFLAWTMPIYFGATNIAKYFPSESFVWLDVDDPGAPRRIAEIVGSDLAERNRDAIAEARRRVLEEHNLFPRLARLIAEDPSSNSAVSQVTLPHVPDLTQYYMDHGPLERTWHSIRRNLGFVR